MNHSSFQWTMDVDAEKIQGDQQKPAKREKKKQPVQVVVLPQYRCQTAIFPSLPFSIFELLAGELSQNKVDEVDIVL